MKTSKTPPPIPFHLTLPDTPPPFGLMGLEQGWITYACTACRGFACAPIGAGYPEHDCDKRKLYRQRAQTERMRK